MLNFLKKKSKLADAIPHYNMPEGEIVYAIGDVHGCYMSMINLLEKIEIDRRSRPEGKSTVVFLGDLIDRGPASREVVEFLMNYKPDWTNVAYIRGNHEEVMLDVLSGNISAMRSWFEFGGKDCARSYGVDNFGQLHINPDHIMMALHRNVPKQHLAFLDSFSEHPVKVVHGHSVVEDEPEIHSNRIAVDTGAHKGRPLTAVCLCAGQETFIQSEALGS